jgi:hypothetical protein
LINDGLWGLTFGNGGNGGNTNTLYLTAGLNDEADGLFAQINAGPTTTSTPEPATFGLLAVAIGLLVWKRR